MTLLILFDSDADRAQKENLITNMKRISSTWARLLPNAWLITSTQDSGMVRDELKGYIPGNKIIVINVTGDGWATSFISDEVTAWMKENL